jgi:carboxymethylenebutenolidase
VQEQLVDIPTAAGAIDTFFAHPSDAGAYPTVLVYVDVWGLREELFDIARRIATVARCRTSIIGKERYGTNFATTGTR